MFNYGSQLFSIAAGAGSTPLRSYSVDALNAITTANAAAAQQTVDAAVASLTPASPAAPAQEAAPAPEPEADQATAAISIVTSDVEPGFEPTAIAKATSEALDIPVAPPHPVAASVPVEVSVEIELPKVDPVEAMPPVVVPGTTKVTEIRGNKGRRKQT
jgi:hypothetical protein